MVTPLRTLLLCIALTCTASPVLAQRLTTADAAVDRELERILGELASEDAEGEHDVDDLLWLHEHPIDLRTAEAAELAALPGIDHQAAIAIVSGVRHLLPRSHAELASELSLSREQLLSLRAFTTLAGDPSNETRASARARVEGDLVARRGSSERLSRIVRTTGGAVDTVDVGRPYRGDPFALVMQLGISRGPLELAATLAKDRGEPVVHRDTLRYFYARNERAGVLPADSPHIATRMRMTSFLGASLAWRSGPLALVVGDFTAEFGQGLALSDGRRRFSRSNGASAAHVAARRIAPSRSSDESAYLRGIGVEATIERHLPFRISLAALASWRWLDASITAVVDSDGVDRSTVASIRRDGNRRTTSEIRRSGNALERLVALNASIENEHWSVGGTVLRSSLGAEHSTHTEANRAWSIDARVSTRSATAYAECAGDGARLAVVGGLFARSGATTVLVAGRYLPEGIDLAHGRAFPRAAAPAAERGVYAALECTPIERLRLSLDVDLFHRPLPSATVPFPHSGTDAGLSLAIEGVDGVSLLARIDRSHDLASASVVDEHGRAHRGLVALDRTRARAALSLERPAFTLRARVGLAVAERSAGTSQQHGWMTALDGSCQVVPSLELKGSLALFDGDGSDAALYIAESDLPGRVRSVQLSGSGRRLGLAARWRPVESLRVAVAVEETVYGDRRRVGSGLEEIEGPRRASAAVQLEWRMAATTSRHR